MAPLPAGQSGNPPPRRTVLADPDKGPRLRELISAAVRGGAFDYIAAEAVGVSDRTFRWWMQRGRAAEARRELLESLAYRDLQTEAKGLGLSATGSREAILGRLTAAEEPYVQLFEDVTTAHALARVEAERSIQKSLPLQWLRYGPGREKQDRPGWTNPQEGKVEVIGAGGGPVQAEVRAPQGDVPLERRAEILQVLVDVGAIAPRATSDEGPEGNGQGPREESEE